jgi:hypothetical protein
MIWTCTRTCCASGLESCLGIAQHASAAKADEDGAAGARDAPMPAVRRLLLLFPEADQAPGRVNGKIGAVKGTVGFRRSIAPKETSLRPGSPKRHTGHRP